MKATRCSSPRIHQSGKPTWTSSPNSCSACHLACPSFPRLKRWDRLRFKTYLREVLECGKCHNVALTIKDSDSQESWFDQLKDSWVRVYSVVHIVFANFDQVDDLVAVIRVGSSQDESVIIEIILLFLLVSLKFWVHFFVSLFVLFCCSTYISMLW